MLIVNLNGVCYTFIIFSIMSIVFNTFFFTTYIMLVIEIKLINQSMQQLFEVDLFTLHVVVVVLCC